MPSALAHALTGYAIYRVAAPRLASSGSVAAYRAGAAVLVGFSLLPDLDTLPGVLSGDLLGYHRNLVHSPAIGVAVALVCAAGLSRGLRRPFVPWLGVLLLAWLAHLAMDSLSVGQGVMWLWPVDPSRFEAPLKLFYGVRWWEGVWYAGHLWTLVTEGAFLVALFAVVGVVERRRASRAALSPPDGGLSASAVARPRTRRSADSRASD